MNLIPALAGYVAAALRKLRMVGINISSSLDVWMWMLGLTGIFNALHVLLSLATSLVILKATIRKIPSIACNIWLSQHLA